MMNTTLMQGGSSTMAASSSLLPPQQQQPPQPPPPMMTTTMPLSSPPNNNPRSRPEDAARHITVSDPVQHADGLNKYTSYRVDVRPPDSSPNDPSSGGGGGGGGMSILPPSSNNVMLPPSAVLRRYSDFLWLYEQLQMTRPGSVVPPIPEKQPVGRFSPSFVEERRVHLERFVRRASVHPELYDCQCLDTFLRADDVTFQAAKAIKATAGSGGGGMSNSTMQGGSSFMAASGMMPQQQQPGGPANKANQNIKRWFKEAKTSMTGDLVRSPDDDLFEEIQRYVAGLDSQMRNVSHQATGLVRKGKEMANGLFEFGLAFNLLGQSEADALGNALSQMGETADKLSVLAAEQAEREMAQFEEPLQDYIKTIHAVKLALQRRHEKRLTYSTCLADVESKNLQLNKLRAQIGSEAKAYSVEMSLRRASENADLARDEFCACSQRVLREVDRFKREKAEDMRRTVLDYINIQVEYNKRMEEVWASLIPELEKVPAVEGTPANANNTDLMMPQAQQAALPPPMTVSPDASQMMINNNPQQQQTQQQGAVGAGSYYQESPQQQPQQVPAPQTAPMGGDPTSMISVQYREAPSGAL